MKTKDYGQNSQQILKTEPALLKSIIQTCGNCCIDKIRPTTFSHVRYGKGSGLLQLEFGNHD